VLAKDVRVLARAKLLVASVIAYPLLVAVLIGLVAGFAASRPRVALVDLDGLPPNLELGGQTLDLDGLIERVAVEVRLVRLDAEEAQRQLETGKVVATVTVPEGFVADLRGMIRSPRLVLRTAGGGLSPRVSREVQALVYALNRRLQRAYIAQNLAYIQLLIEGGNGEVFGRRLELLGLERTRALLDELPSGPRLDRIRRFVDVAESALEETDEALRATANPIELTEAPERGRSWALSAQAQAFGLALTAAFLALVLAAAALAAERDEGVLPRFRAGFAGPNELLGAKLGLAALAAAAVGILLAVGVGVAVEVGDVPGGQPWSRLPLLVPALALAGGAIGALGVLLGAVARDARTASLVAVLVALPLLLLALVPDGVSVVVSAVSDAFPVVHSVELFEAALYERSPWSSLAVEASWLLALGLVYAAAARRAMRRLFA
jgi:hypothetical protein